MLERDPWPRTEIFRVILLDFDDRKDELERSIKLDLERALEVSPSVVKTTTPLIDSRESIEGKNTVW